MSEAGYEEMRRFFDYVREIRLVGPRHANDGRVENGKPNGSNGTTNGANGTNGTNGTSSREGVEICMVDADDLLDNPTGIIERFCNSVGVEYTPEMLIWDTEEAQSSAKAAFEKWPGFHEDALSSGSLKARAHVRFLHRTSITCLSPTEYILMLATHTEESTQNRSPVRRRMA